jgi:hypothetical protein
MFLLKAVASSEFDKIVCEVFFSLSFISSRPSSFSGMGFRSFSCKGRFDLNETA